MSNISEPFVISARKKEALANVLWWYQQQELEWVPEFFDECGWKKLCAMLDEKVAGIEKEKLVTDQPKGQSTESSSGRDADVESKKEGSEAPTFGDIEEGILHWCLPSISKAEGVCNPPMPQKWPTSQKEEKNLLLQQLYLEMENFSQCALSKGALNTVCGDGNPDALVMFVGEAPGAEEDKQGKPFVGASGKLLDRMLLSIGRSRLNSYITNVVLWRPPFNRQPSAQEIQQCLPLLQKHIAIVRPAVLVTLGAVAYKTLLPNNTVTLTAAHRRVFSYSYTGADATKTAQTVPIFPLYHPAYLLRAPQNKGLAWVQLQRVRYCLEKITHTFGESKN